MSIEEVDYEEVYETQKTGYEKLPKEVQKSIAKISGRAEDKKADSLVLTYLLFGAVGGAFAYIRNKRVLHGIGFGLITAYLYTTFVETPKKQEKNDDNQV